MSKDVSFFEETITGFTHKLDALVYTAPLVDVILAAGLLVTSKKTSGFQSEANKILEKRKDQFTAEEIFQFQTLRRWISNESRVMTSRVLLNESHVVIITSQLDGLLSKLIQGVIVTNPSFIKEKELNLKVHEIDRHDTINSLKSHIVDIQVEKIMRTGHLDQLSSLTKMLGIKLGDVPNKADIEEVLHRRHMIVHNNSLCNRTYKSIRNNSSLEDTVSFGKKINTDLDYIIHAYSTIWTYGVKLALSIWGKTEPHRADKAHSLINHLSYNLIRKGNYKMAIDLLSYTRDTFSKHNAPNATDSLMHKVNLAQAYKWNGDDQECHDILKAENWEVLDSKFRISYLAFNGQFKKLTTLMEQIGKDDEFEINYQEWPIFREASLRQDFLDAYEKIFGKKYSSRHKEEADFVSSIVGLTDLFRDGKQTDFPFTSDN